MMTTTKTPTLRTQNITRAFRDASPADRAHGLMWYPTANAYARELDPTNIARGAAVLAVLSPLLSWPRNRVLARQAYDIMEPFIGTVDPFHSPEMLAPQLGCLRGSSTKAFRIIGGANPASVVGGEKVTSFYANILSPEGGDHVTIDRHAIDIAAGKVQSDKDRASAVSRKGSYDKVAAMYVSAAKILSKEMGVYILPSQVQAVTWVHWRNTMAAANHKG